MSTFNKTLTPSGKTTYSQDEVKYLKKIGLKIQRDIRKDDGSVERFCWDNDISRSGLNDINAGRKNSQIVHLRRIAQALGYRELTDFLKTI